MYYKDVSALRDGETEQNELRTTRGRQKQTTINGTILAKEGTLFRTLVYLVISVHVNCISSSQLDQSEKSVFNRKQTDPPPHTRNIWWWTRRLGIILIGKQRNVKRVSTELSQTIGKSVFNRKNNLSSVQNLVHSLYRAEVQIIVFVPPQEEGHSTIFCIRLGVVGRCWGNIYARTVLYARY